MEFYYFLSQQLLNSNITNNNLISRKFNIQGIENKLLLQEIKKLFKLDELEIISGEMTKKEIDNLLNKIRLSGFFKEVQLSNTLINNSQIITFNLNVNPILLKINLINNKYLLIPQKFLISLFTDQIGYPKNFRKMHNAIQEIYKWYYNKGFKWVRIEILDSKQDINSINIKISEGIINSIQFHCPNINQNSIDSIKYAYLIKSLKKCLRLEENTRLNHKKIEQGIKAIKYKNILENCDYRVNYSAKNRNEIDIIINLYHLADRATYLTGKNITLITEIIESIEANLYNSLNILLKHYILSSFYYIKNINKISKPKSIVSATIVHSIDDKSFTTNIDSIMTNKKLYIFTDLYEWYINSPILRKNNHIKLKHYLRNLGKEQQYFTLDFEIPNVSNEMNMVFCLPWIYLIDEYSGELQIKILEKSFDVKSSSIVEAINQFTKSNFLLTKSMLNVKKIIINCNYEINSKIKLTKSLEISQVNDSYKCLKNKNVSYINTYLGAPYIKRLYFQRNLFLHYLSRLEKKTSYNYLSMILEINYISKDKNINWIKKGMNIKFLSQFFLPIRTFYTFYTTHCYKKFISKSIIKSTLYSACGKHKLTEKKQFIISDIEIGNILGYNHILPITESFHIPVPYTIKACNKYYKGLPKLFYKFTLEYHRPITRLNNLFIFFDYIYLLPSKLKFIKTDINRILFIDSVLENYHYNASLGLGIQFRLPLKQIPAIRLEYGLNIIQHSYLHLRVAGEFSNII